MKTLRVEVDLRSDGALVTAQVDPEDWDAFTGSQTARTGIVHDELSVGLAYGWTYYTSNAALRRTQHRNRSDGNNLTVTFRAYGGVASRSTVAPITWVVPIEIGHAVPLGNVETSSVWFLSGRLKVSSSGWCGLRFEGEYPYVLVEAERVGDKSAYALVIETAGRSLEPLRLARDLLALQFVLGQRLEVGLAFGLDGTDVTMIAAPWTRGTGQSINAHPVIGQWHFEGAWAVDFFECVSSAMRNPAIVGLVGALDIVIRSFDLPMDLAAQNLLLSIAALTASRPDLAPLDHGTRAREFLRAHNLVLPNDLAMGIDQASQTLASRGAVSSERSNDESLRAVLDLLTDLRTVVVALVAVNVDYRGLIVGRPATEEPPPWWPLPSGGPKASSWSASGPPEDLTHGLREDQILVLVERPDQSAIIRWLIRAAALPESKVVVAAAASPMDFRYQLKLLGTVGDRLIGVADMARGHVPSARARLRNELDLASGAIELAPAIPCVEAWLLADDELVASTTNDDATRLRATASLPEEIDDPRSLAQEVFGPPAFWSGLPRPDIYRAADRSPSLRNLLNFLGQRLGVTSDLPARSAARGLSRDAIAGLIRSLLSEDAIAWRTSDGSSYTAEALAREVEQGTEIGRQYAVDIVSMMINALSRNAKRSGTQ